jgi:guanosine-3',5'-bis(diphosphate) 3'-pyrophosphohydrolase
LEKIWITPGAPFSTRSLASSGMDRPAPDFARSSALLDGAYRMAREAHHGPRRRGDTDIDHPVEVARILFEHGFDQPVVAAALLHDVVEDTATSTDEIAGRYGPEVARLVSEMTEDEAIEPYEERKAEHRERVSHDPSAAAIYAADKLATTRTLEDRPDPERLDHYVQTFRMLCDTHPDLPFLDELRGELERLATR